MGNKDINGKDIDEVLKKDEKEIDQYYKGILAAGKFYSVTLTITISNIKAAIL